MTKPFDASNEPLLLPPPPEESPQNEGEEGDDTEQPWAEPEEGSEDDVLMGWDGKPMVSDNGVPFRASSWDDLGGKRRCDELGRRISAMKDQGTGYLSVLIGKPKE